VAQLKLQKRREHYALGRLFPRRKIRGPIEAARTFSHTQQQTNRFPRRKIRGPIEAVKPTSGTPITIPYFHGEKSVAQLKHQTVFIDLARYAHFHGEKSVAQLKHIFSPCFSPLPAGFPRRKIRGPIEARSSFHHKQKTAAHFHGEKSVAQLKRWFISLSLHHVSVHFHGEKSVAQLKRGKSGFRTAS